MRTRSKLGLVALATVAFAAPTEAIVPGPNGRIAFESNRTGNNEILTVNPDGGASLNVTRNPADDVFPAWSPTGTQLTFSSDRHRAGDLDVFKVDADGSGLVQLTDAPGEDRGTSWTSDGQTIVFHSQRHRDADHAFDVFKMDADGSGQTQIIGNASAAYVCGDSTNGVVVFNSNGDPLGTNPTRDFEIFTADLSGGDLRQLTSNTVLDSGPKWAPDCATISFNRTDAGGSLDVHRMDADGTNVVNLTNAPGIFDAFSAWSPDGQQIVFSSNRDGNFELFTLSSVDGSGVTQITTTGEGESNVRADWGTGALLAGASPQTAEECKKSNFKSFSTPRRFSNQGECVSSVRSRRP